MFKVYFPQGQLINLLQAKCNKFKILDKIYYAYNRFRYQKALCKSILYKPTIGIPQWNKKNTQILELNKFDF